jgi:hypothetical protein
MKSQLKLQKKSVFVSPHVGRLEFRNTQVWLRPLRSYAPPQFFSCWNASHYFIETAKLSHTAKTILT